MDDLTKYNGWIVEGDEWVNQSTGERAPVAQGSGPAVSNQFSFWFRNDDGNLTTATYMDNQGDDQTIGTGVDNKFRLRILFQETNGGNFVYNHSLYYSVNTGAYVAVSGASTQLRYVDDDNAIANDSQINSATLVGGSGSFTTGRYCDGGAITAITLANTHSVMEVCLYIVDADVNNGDTIDIRLRDGGVVLDSYTDTPRVTVSKGAASQTVNLSEASLSFTGDALAPKPGGRNIGLNEGALAFAGDALAPKPGGRNVGLNEAAVSFTGDALAPKPGARTVGLSEGSLTFTPDSLTVNAGASPQTVTLNEATMSFTGDALAPKPGGRNVGVNEAALAIAGDALAPKPGGRNIGLSEGTLTFTPDALTVSVAAGPQTISLSEATLALTPDALDVVPGAHVLELATALLTATGVQSVVVPGAVTVELSEGALTLTGDAATISTLAATVVSLDTASITFTGDAATMRAVIPIMLTLADRTAALTVESRSRNVTLADRAVTLTLEGRD